MCDVDEELVAGAHRVGQADRRGAVAFDEEVVRGVGNAVGSLHHHHRQAVGPLDEVAVCVGCEQWNVKHVRIGEVDAEEIARLRLDHGPCRHAADLGVGIGPGAAEMPVGAQVTVGDQLAGRDRMAGGIKPVGA